MLVVLLLGAAGGIGLAYGLDHKSYKPPTGVTIFAVFYIIAQALERLLEPFANLYVTTPSTADNTDAVQPAGELGKTVGSKKLITKGAALKRRDVAVAAVRDDKVKAESAASGQENPTPLAEVAWWDEILAQIRVNKTTLWGLHQRWAC